MDNSPTTSDLIAQRIRELRKARGGMTVAELARRCRAAGIDTLTAQALYKLEGQRSNRSPRPVSADELLVLAYVLDIAPVHLICGLDDDVPLPAGRGWTVDAPGAREWIRGRAPLTGGNAKLYRATVPASEENTLSFTISDVTSYEEVRQALEAMQAYVSLQQWREETGN